MPETKQERAERGRQLAATAAAEAVLLDRAGRRDDAEAVMVHAYHEGATAMDLLDQYHEHKVALDADPGGPA